MTGNDKINVEISFDGSPPPVKYDSKWDVLRSELKDAPFNKWFNFSFGSGDEAKRNSIDARRIVCNYAKTNEFKFKTANRHIDGEHRLFVFKTQEDVE